MNVRRMGRTGLKVTEICLGTMTFGHQCDERTSFAILDKAAERGVTFLDTADVYPVPPSPDTAGRSEEIIGRWLHGKRDRLVLATKCRMRVGHGPNDEGLSRKHVFKPAWQIALALGVSERRNWARFDCLQPRYNLLYRELETEHLPLCRDQGLGVIAYNPLAGGFLSGKYQTGQTPPTGTRFTLGKTGDLYRERYWQNAQFEAVNQLRAFFQKRGKSLVQVAVAWVLAQPGITSAIVGASRPEQLDDSLSAVDLKLDSEELEACNLAWFSLPRLMKTPT